MFYTQFLQGVHERLRPETYLEVGVRDGRSLTLSRARSVGVDPAFAIEVELDGDLALVRTTSDEYFARPDPLALTGGGRSISPSSTDSTCSRLCCATSCTPSGFPRRGP